MLYGGVERSSQEKHLKVPRIFAYKTWSVISQRYEKIPNGSTKWSMRIVAALINQVVLPLTTLSEDSLPLLHLDSCSPSSVMMQANESK